MIMRQINYSIIIPHKNCPDLLTRSLSSIPDREDVQIIVVDDNSDDDKKPLVDPHKVELIMLDAEHSKGAGRARNIGLEKAEGKWLLFADADDFYTDQLNTLLDKYAEDTDTDMVYLNAYVIDENGMTRDYDSNKLIKAFLEGQPKAEMELRYSIWTPWSRMVKKDMVMLHHIRFDEIPNCNDKMFSLLCSQKAKNIVAELPLVYCYYRPAGGSLTDKSRNPLSLDALLDVRGRTVSLYKEVGYDMIPSFLSFFIGSRYSANLSLAERIKKYKHVLKRNHVSVFTDVKRYLSIKISSHL